MATHGTTRANALREGRKLLQIFGYNGFSFQDLADKLGLKKQSLYVHFETKEDFAHQLLADYKRSIDEWFDTVKEFEPDQKIGAWFDKFYRFACDGSQYCPLNALSSDFNSLVKPLQEAIRQIADERRKWVESIIVEGQKKKIFRRDMSTKTLTELVVTLGFGAQQVARITGDPERIKSVKKEMLNLLSSN
jgi:TetR/AcrR family transcriptional repressor of nem operon